MSEETKDKETADAVTGESVSAETEAAYEEPQAETPAAKKEDKETPQPVAKAEPQKSPRGTSPVAWLALFLALLTLAATGYMVVEDRRTRAVEEASGDTLERLSGRIEDSQASLSGLEDQLEDLASSDEALESSIADLQRDFERRADLLDSLPGRMSNLENSVAAMQGASAGARDTWLLAEAEFLAIVLVLVYVGAVMVLFLFVVMMLEVNIEAAKRGLTRYAPLGLGLALVMAIELVNVIWLRTRIDETVGGFVPTPEGYSNTQALGAVLYTEHVFAFEIAAVILLLAIIAAITLTMRRRPGLKVQNIAKQVAVRAKDRVRVVKMDAEEKQ